LALIIHYILLKLISVLDYKSTTNGIYSAHENQSKVFDLKNRVVSLKQYLLKNDMLCFSNFRKCFKIPLTCYTAKLNITQIIFIEDIGKIIKGALEVFSS